MSSLNTLNELENLLKRIDFLSNNFDSALKIAQLPSTQVAMRIAQSPSTQAALQFQASYAPFIETAIRIQEIAEPILRLQQQINLMTNIADRNASLSHREKIKSQAAKIKDILLEHPENLNYDADSKTTEEVKEISSTVVNISNHFEIKPVINITINQDKKMKFAQIIGLIANILGIIINLQTALPNSTNSEDHQALSEIFDSVIQSAINVQENVIESLENIFTSKSE